MELQNIWHNYKSSQSYKFYYRYLSHFTFNFSKYLKSEYGILSPLTVLVLDFISPAFFSVAYATANIPSVLNFFPLLVLEVWFFPGSS